jgi:hypothetical protein
MERRLKEIEDNIKNSILRENIEIKERLQNKEERLQNQEERLQNAEKIIENQQERLEIAENTINNQEEEKNRYKEKLQRLKKINISGRRK